MKVLCFGIIPGDFKVMRPKQGHPTGPRARRYLRKGIVDIRRRAEVSQAANERYLDALASLETDRPLRQIIEPVCRPTRWKGRRMRPLQPWSDADRALLHAISRGEFAMNGFRNRDLLSHLFPDCDATGRGRRRISARVTRMIRLMRSHGIIRKQPRQHRYTLSPRGREIATAALESQAVTLKQLTSAAA
jgi:hypothetical protein